MSDKFSIAIAEFFEAEDILPHSFPQLRCFWCKNIYISVLLFLLQIFLQMSLESAEVLFITLLANVENLDYFIRQN